MKRFDVAVIGATRAGLMVADALSAQGRSVALVKTPGDDDADRLMAALEGIPETEVPAVRFETLTGPARFLSPSRLSVGEGEVEALRFVITVGAVPAGEWDLGTGPFPPVISAFSGTAPASAAILGAGPVAVVAADRLARQGADVTVLTKSTRLVPEDDDSVSDAITGRLRARGVKIHTGATAVTWSPSGVTRWTGDGGPQEIKTEALFAETDLRAALDGLDLKQAGVLAHPSGRIVVNDEMRTSAPRIWAAGQAVSPGGPLAEHAAQAENAANNVFAGVFGKRKLETALPPAIIRTTPPIARVGLTEREARARYADVVTAVTQGESFLVKIIGRRRGGKLLGAHILGSGAPESILFFDVLLRAELPLEDVPDRRHFPMPGGTDAIYRALLAWSASAANR